jgi:MFS family permease
MYVLSFLFTLHISLSAYVNSTFLVQFISEKYVGILYTVASLITLVMLSMSARILKQFGNRKLVLWLLLINMVALGFMITSASVVVIVLAFISLLATNALIFLCLDIFIEHFGNPATIGKTRGLYLTILNIAWVLSPLITALLITQEGGYVAIYILGLIATAIMTIGLFFSVKTFHDQTYKRTPFLETYRYLKTNRHMLAITIINFILQFFFAWMVVYTPIYLHQHIGFGWDQIGVMFTVMLVPFVIFGLPIGILIDRYHISKRLLLYIGFVIMSAATIAIPFITIKSLALWSLVLFLTRVGASIIETTSETYFFTHIKEEDAYLLGVFRDMAPVAYIIAPLLATLFFTAFPFKYLFIALGIIVLAGFHYIPRLKHNHENILPTTNQ